MNEENTKNVIVSEDKFNATSTITVANAESVEEAEMLAERFFRDEYGHSPSNAVGKKEEYALTETRYKVMVADHSSGSLKKGREYERERAGD